MDLSERNTDLLRLKRVAEPDTDSCTTLLEFPNQWYVGSKSECSCTFRHLHSSSVELGFGEPVDWYPEDQDEVDATKELFSVLAWVVSSGFNLDLISQWEGSQLQDIITLDVFLHDISERTFRMFEDHKFRFKQ